MDENKLFKILTIMRYNSERFEDLYELLIKFLKNPKKQFNVKQEFRRLVKEKRKIEEFSLRNFFSTQGNVVQKNLSVIDAINYVEKRFFSYDKIFLKHYGFPIKIICLLARDIYNFILQKDLEFFLKDEVYRFRNGKEYTNLSFLANPEQKFTKRWKNIITFTFDDLWIYMKKKDKNLKKYMVYEPLKFYTLDLNKIKNKQHPDLFTTPILKLGNKYIIIDPAWVLRFLPRRYNFLLKQFKKYNETKGRFFEKIVVDLLKSISFAEVHPFIKYKEGELDALVNFKNSSWYVEISSRVPHQLSYKGYLTKIDEDIKRTILKCRRQALKAINSSDSTVKKFGPKKKKGILIVLEGLFPNLNCSIHHKRMGINLTYSDETLPVYIINYFDLVEILRQPDSFLFDDSFLFWRTEKNNPIFCLDELDYWAYYTKHIFDNDTALNYELSKKKNLTVVYISQRFNNRSHLPQR